MEATAVVVQRLIGLGGRIENLESRRPERDAVAGFNPNTGVVRSAVPKCGTCRFN